MIRRRMNSVVVSLVVAILALSSFASAGTTPQCSSTPYIKSIWPALVELDPYTLRVKDRHSFWEITKTTASPYGNYAWGLSGLPTEGGPDLYFLHSINNLSGNTNIYRINLATGKSTQYLALSVRASGIAQRGSQFYVAFYDSAKKQNIVQRVGGEKVILPETIGALDYVSDPSGDYLLAITGKLASHKVFKIPLDASGNLLGSYSVAVTIQVGLSSPLYPYTYTGITYARIPSDDGEREVIYVSKDNGNYEPSDIVALVDLETGQVLNTMIATDSGIVIDPPIKWPNGVTSDYLSWANPQGLQYIEDIDKDGNPIGRLFMITRYYWNKGPVCKYVPAIDIEKYVSVDDQVTWLDADSPPGPSVTEGSPVYFKFIVTNTGTVSLTDINVSDTDFALNGCTIPSSLDPNQYFECIVGPVSAVQGQHKNAATVTGVYNSQTVTDSDSANYFGEKGQAGTTLSAEKTATGTWKRAFSWTIDKSVNPETLNLFRGDTGTAEYTVSVTKDGGTDEAFVEGQVCVTNGGERPTENLKIVDTVQYKTGPGQFQDYVSVLVDLSAKPVLNPGESYCYPYKVVFVPVPEAQYRNAAKVTITNHSGHLGEEFGPEPKESFSLPAEPILVNDSIHVDDTNGQSWVFNASGSQVYSKGFTCDTDSGVHQNTATIRETGQSDSASVTVNCYSLNVTKDASTSFTRTYRWTIDKEGDQVSLTLGIGEAATVNYSVRLDATYADSDWAVEGKIYVSNPAPMAATINGVTDIVSPDIAATVDCGVSFPYSLSAFGTLQCTYVASLPDASARTNTATATLQNTPSGTTDFSGSASVDFSTATMTEVDKTITVSDDLYGNLGSVTYGVDTLPKTFSYSLGIGPYTSPGTYIFVNTASVTQGPSDSWTVTVEIISFGCTYTQGYWKNHCGFTGNNPDLVSQYLPIWLGTPPASGNEGDNDSVRVETNQESHDILYSEERENGVIKLYIQLLAAKLNIANGADDSAVQATVQASDAFLAEHGGDDWDSLSEAEKQQVLDWMETLDQYNNGVIGPGHCE